MRFKKILPKDARLMREIYRLRYQVYCHECNFIDPEDCFGGLEVDKFDKHAIHFAAIDPAGHVVGTMRMILGETVLLPIEELCPEKVLSHKSGPGEKAAELSRLIITKDHRQKPFFIILGLSQLIHKECVSLGITRLYAFMELRLWMLLQACGLDWQCMGRQLKYFGNVSPYTGSVHLFGKSLQRSPRVSQRKIR